MNKLTATEVQIIAKGMEKDRLQRELQDNRDKWTNKELSDSQRKIRLIKLKQVNREYKELIKKWGYKEEKERYMEREAERRREDEILRRDDLYDYDCYND